MQHNIIHKLLDEEYNFFLVLSCSSDYCAVFVIGEYKIACMHALCQSWTSSVKTAI